MKKYMLMVNIFVYLYIFLNFTFCNADTLIPNIINGKVSINSVEIISLRGECLKIFDNRNGYRFTIENTTNYMKLNTNELAFTYTAGRKKVVVSKQEPIHIDISAYPNPFNPFTTIKFTINNTITARVTLDVYGLNGQK
ncbi:hypothetical protein LLG96_05195 [bacterium]|nr:hypothetical protein [bacterium]